MGSQIASRDRPPAHGPAVESRSGDGSARLGNRAANAAEWQLACALVSAVCQFAIGALLARLLAPRDFGLVALAFVILGLSNLVGDLGMGGAVIQRSDLAERHVRTAFTLSVAVGLALAAIIAISAPLGAALMKEPRLTLVLRILALGFVFRGFGVVASALLTRRLDFKTAFLANLGSYLLGYAGVAVTLALLGFGVWSLVWGGLMQALLSAIFLFAAAPHASRPLLGRPELRDLLGFGAGLTLNGFVNYAATNGDNFVTGRWIGSAGLGLYSRAYMLMSLPQTYMASVLSSVLFPAFSEVQGDLPRLRRGYLLASRVTALSAGPVMVGMAVAAPHLIRGIYGPRWAGTVAPLQVLCMAGFFRALYHLGGSVTRATGRIYEELLAQAGYAALVIGGCLLASRFGIVGVAWAVLVAVLYMYMAMAALVLHITGIRWTAYLGSQLAGAGVALIVGACALPARLTLERLGLPSLVIATILAGACAVVWLAALLLLLESPGFRPLADRLPLRLRPLMVVSARMRRRLGLSSFDIS